MVPEWVRTLWEECLNAGIPFFFKQWGGATRVLVKENGYELDGEVIHEFPDPSSTARKRTTGA